MLHKSQISNIPIYTPEWQQIRCGRITSSNASKIIGDGKAYVYQKAGEYTTGKVAKEESVETEDTVHGNMYEIVAIQEFGRQMNLKFLVTQTVIISKDGRSASTPDAIIPKQSIKNEDEYLVKTLEVKCPPTYHNFLLLYECTIPTELKSVKKEYFWQVVHQMQTCGATEGYFACYHPDFPSGKNMRIISFNKMDLHEDFKLLIQRQEQAIKKMDEIKSLFY